jgi:hypothetical protein
MNRALGRPRHAAKPFRSSMRLVTIEPGEAGTTTATFECRGVEGDEADEYERLTCSIA